MCEAANQISRQYGAETVQLVGYSGGGAIVVGMRSCTDRLNLVTTIAGNLDPAAWTDHHGYSALHGESLIGGARSMRVGVTEVHWQCADDENIPPEITDKYFTARPEAKRQIVESCTHASGWQQYFSEMVETGTTH
jgi:poly(3-hydroxybutyrate) depolymerase